MKHFVRYIIFFLMIFTVVGCYDELMEEESIGDGKAVISATLDFKPMSSALTRAGGNALGDILSLHVLLYDYGTGELIDGGKWKIKDLSVSDGIPRSDADADNGQTAETATKSASFTLPEEINFGKYYMYAVANIPDLLENPDYGKYIQTVEGLKNLPLTWNTEDLSANGQMLGFFTKASDSAGASDGSVELNEKTVKLHAWMRRAASKVTVAFDGSKLKDGVSIRIKSVRIKNIPASCRLGAENTAGEGGLIDGEEVDYSGDADAFVTNEVRYFPRKQVTDEGGSVSWVKDPESHSETNPHSLFFYENRQGAGEDMPDKRQLDENGDGLLDGLYPYKEIPYATFIEVDTYYESSNPDRPGISNITYRFMLGQDVKKDYNATRNCHYKLTLNFKNFANEADWRIDYVTRLWATQPETVDYRGKYFEPDNVSSNQGHLFKDDNSITVTSFMYDRNEWNTRLEQNYKTEYRDAGTAEFTDKCPDWIESVTEKHEGDGVYKLTIKYKNKFKEYNINDTLLNNDPKEGIYDLATKGGSGKMNTANCYIVDSKGTYRFPLVYGNAITDDNENDDSYKYRGGRTGIHYLQVFKNYNDQPVESAYILDDIYGSAENAPSGLSASLLWQDENNLIKPESVIYVPGDYGGKGGIQFEIGDIKEGNAVIALRDATAEKVIIWSWHIWVTSLDLSKNITIHRPNISLDEWTHLPERDFEIMPVNLGWCSGGIPVRYYDRHECEVRFTQILDDGQEGLSKTVTIVQEPHVAVPMGNNPYFQWGRKDPFIAGGNADGTNKTWYDGSNGTKTSAPEQMYATDADRVKTFDATARLIRNPHKWQNCPRKPDGSGYLPKDSIFFNLWDNSFWDGDDNVVKTIYDPCPAGYHVSSIYTFNGFVDSGQNIQDDIVNYMYAATDENMMQEDDYKNGIFEFYTDRTKLISLGFPQNGYRDWDANAGIYTMNTIGQVWSAQTIPYDWGPTNPFYAYYFKYSRNSFIRPFDYFYATDGFPVRPTATAQQE